MSRPADPAAGAVDRFPVDGERRFVFALARPGTPPTPPAGADWPRLLAFAQRVGAGVALARAVAAADGGSLPLPVQAAVRRLGMAGTFAQRYLLDRLRQSLGALAEAGIPVMPIKGAAHLLADPERAMARTMGDIDLLVPAADRARARTVLLGVGWAASTLEARTDFYAQHHHLPPLDDARGTGLSLEVHSEPFPAGHPFGMAAEALWSGATAAPALAGVLLPAPRPALLHACIHFAWAHMAESGAWRLVHDVAALGSAPGFDWEAFVGEARAARARTACYWSLRLAGELGGIAVPAATLAALAPRQPRIVRERLMRHLVLQTLEDTPCPSRLLRRGLWQAMLEPRREGHGSARPWARDAVFGSPEGEPAPGEGDEGAMARLRRAAAAVRYLSRALGGGAVRPASGAGLAAAGLPLR